MREAQAEGDVLAAVDARVRRTRRRRWLAAAASAVGLAVLGLMSRESTTADRGFSASSIQTTAIVSMPPTQVLADGSIVELREGAEVSVDYSGLLRRVTLHRGEAHFRVAPNKARPFVVFAAGVEAQALGTAFSVQLQPHGVEVLVAEGRVAVDTAAPAETPATERAPPAVLAAGHRARVAMGGGEADAGARPQAVAVDTVSAPELTERLSWRVARLEFSRTPLAEVVALMNRHANAQQPVRFALADDSLRDVKLSGFLRADNADGLIELLAANFGIVAERRGAVEIVLRRGAAALKRNNAVESRELRAESKAER